MGSAIARAFLTCGMELHVWNRTRSRAEPLERLGAKVAETVLDAIQSADVVVVNLNTYRTAARLLKDEAISSALKGKPLIQLTSGSPKQSRELGAWAARHGIPYLDGAILVTPRMIGSEAGVLLCCGPRSLFQQQLPVLRALGENIQWLGEELGHASTLDTALLAFFWSSLFGAIQGAAVAKAEGYSLGAYAQTLSAMMPVAQVSAERLIRRIAAGQLEADQDTPATVQLCHEGVKLLIEVCQEQQLEHSIPAAHERLLRAAIDAGHADGDLSVLDLLISPAASRRARSN